MQRVDIAGVDASRRRQIGECKGDAVYRLDPVTGHAHPEQFGFATGLDPDCAEWAESRRGFPHIGRIVIDVVGTTCIVCHRDI